MKRRDLFRGFAGLVGAAAVAPLVPQFAAGGAVKAPARQLIGRGTTFEIDNGDGVFRPVTKITSLDRSMSIDFEASKLIILA